MALTKGRIEAAKPLEKRYKLTDSDGLQLWVYPIGSKLWQLAYRFEGKQKTLALGKYPDVSLQDARERMRAARKIIAAGEDPSAKRKEDKERAREKRRNTFAAVAAEYIGKRERDDLAPATLKKINWYASLLNPTIGTMPVSGITPKVILDAVRKLEKRGRYETANECLRFAGRVFRYAVQNGWLASDPTRDMKGALVAPKVTHRAAITDTRACLQLA